MWTVQVWKLALSCDTFVNSKTEELSLVTLKRDPNFEKKTDLLFGKLHEEFGEL